MVYVRISQDREGAGLGVARQREDCVALVDKLGWSLVEVYADNDVSASSGKPRPGYLRLLADLRAGKGDAVVAWHPDRLHRSPRELEDFIDTVEKARATVATVRAGDLDLATPSGRAVARTLGAWARYETDAKSDRIRRKMQELATAGSYAGGGRPFGFDNDGVTLRADEAKHLRAATKAVLDGRSLGEVARDLNDKGVLTATGKPWARTPLRQTLLRARNAGLRQHQGEVIGRASWPAIIPEDEWREVCAVLRDPSRRPAGTNRARWLGSGIYLCGVCGGVCRTGTVTDRSGVRRTVYRCAAHRDGSVRAPGGHVARHAPPVDELVAGVILGRLARPDAQDLLTPAVADDGTGVAEQLARLRARQQSVALDFADGSLDADQLRTITARLRERIADLEAALPRPPSLAVERLTAAGDLVPEVWAAMDLAAQREVLDTLLCVRLLPSGRRGKVFDPELVEVTFR